MPSPKRFPIAAKLFGAFALVLVLLLAVSAVGVRGIATLTGHTDAITKAQQPKVVLGDQLRFDAASLHGLQTAYVLDGGKSRAAFLGSAASMERDLAKLPGVAVDAKDRQKGAGVDAAFRRVMALDKATWAAVEAGDTAAAQRIALGSGLAAFKQLETTAADYVDDAR